MPNSGATGVIPYLSAVRMVWAVSDVPSWYKNAKGHVTQNWPFSLLEYWERTRQPEPADFTFIGVLEFIQAFQDGCQ